VSQPQRQHGGRRRALGEGTRRRLFCMTPRSTSVGPFCCRSRGWLACYSAGFLWRERVILRAREASGGERGRPTGTSKQRDQASDLLRREREREYCCRNGSGILRRESEWCRKKKTETSNNNRHLRCDKKGDPRWQSSCVRFTIIQSTC
jgi:hypothetical protein